MITLFEVIRIICLGLGFYSLGIVADIMLRRRKRRKERQARLKMHYTDMDRFSR